MEGPDHALAADGPGVDPGRARGDGHVVDEEPGLEVVGAVHDQIEAGEQVAGVAAGHVLDHGLHVDLGIGLQEPTGRDLGLGAPDVDLMKEDLPLEVGDLHDVPVDEGEGSDARPR